MEHFKRLSVLFLVAAVVLAGSFVFSVPKVFAATGGGTATIAKDGGAQGAGVSVEKSTSHTFTTVLTIDVSGMTLGAASPTFTIPAGFTAPNASPVATAGDVNADGKWSVVSGTGSCVVDSAPGSLTTVAAGQVITVDVTADCADGDTITLTYKGASAVTMAATALTVSTANAGDPGPVTPITVGSPTITVTDTTVPTVVVTMDDSALNIGDTALVTFTFSETPIGFTTADVTVGSGSIGAIDASNPLIQTATYTPTNGVEDAINVITVGTAWTDAALNTGVGDDSPNYTVDTLAPTVTVTMSDAALTVGETSLVTFTFSEAPTGFDATDVSLTNANGTIGAIDASNPLIQTATFTPTNDVTDITNIITVGTAWTDAALNAGVWDDSPNYTVNTTAAASSGGSNTGTITIVKTVINNNSGTKTVADFPLFVNGASVVSGVSNTFPAPAAAYTVTETPSAGYTQTFSGACNADGRLTLNPGDLKICVITNDDIGPPTAVVPPLIDVVKVPSPLALPAGSGPVTYTYTLKNIGTVPVTDITMVGDTCSPIVLASGDTNADKKLQVNETWVYRCSTTLSATHTNVVTTTGWANGISAVDIASATVVVGTSAVPPLIHVTKVPSPLTLPAGGGTVTYTEKISNPGTVALSDVSISDDKCSPVTYVSGDTNANKKLEATETWTYTCRANLTRSTTNTVTVSGDANGLTARDYAIATVLVAAPGLPNTGLPPFIADMPWWGITLLAVIVAAALFYFARRKRTI